MKKIIVLIATHMQYEFPKDDMYIPLHVGREGKKDLGYKGDNTGDNISLKNPFYCELTGLYWAWKNLSYDFLGLVHYRRHFTTVNFFCRLSSDKMKNILNKKEAETLLEEYQILVPKKRKYFIETLYSHYAHTHYNEHLDKTREIISEKYPEFISNFDKVMGQTQGFMFNMFIMKNELVNDYCSWLFGILFELEKKIDTSQYDAYQARLLGRISELLFNVWLDYKCIPYKETYILHMEKINWIRKGSEFIKAKLLKRKFEGSF